MMLEVVHRHEKLAPESGVEFMATVSRAYVRALKFCLRHVTVMEFVDDDDDDDGVRIY